jgi:hypothetical protein
MPRFYFNVYHKRPHTDTDGSELPSHKEAWVEATKSCGEMMRDLDGQLEIGPEWRMEVLDERRRVLFVIRFSAEMGPDFHPV